MKTKVSLDATVYRRGFYCCAEQHFEDAAEKIKSTTDGAFFSYEEGSRFQTRPLFLVKVKNRPRKHRRLRF